MLHKGYTLQGRLECLSNIKNLGYQVGSGFLVGLPEENNASIVKNLKLLKEFECDMAGIGVFIPHQNTPLANCNCGSAEPQYPQFLKHIFDISSNDLI